MIRNQKMMLIALLVMSIIFISGCNSGIMGTVDVNKVDDQTQCRNRGGSYIWLAGKCCPDENSNNMCDDDEAKSPCNDECDQSGCMTDNQFQPYDCVKEKDKCLHKKVVDIQVGRCKVECLDNDGCNLGQKCVHYKCENKICGDGECDNTENCNCEDCKLASSQKCCNGTTVEGNCCNNEDCTQEKPSCISNICVPLCGNGILDQGEECDTTLSNNVPENKSCNTECKLENVPYCGDGTCNGDENCLTCQEDCPVIEGMHCCGGIVAECCLNDDCTGENQTCVENVCSPPIV